MIDDVQIVLDTRVNPGSSGAVWLVFWFDCGVET